MRFSCLCDREVINANDCRCLGSVRDVEINTECGSIEALIVPGPGKYLGFFGRECEFFIPWCKVIRIGPDIILVDFDEKEMRKKLQ
jgi:YlmC/YmxH family sporulation protein